MSHSATVEAAIVIGDRRIDVAKLGPGMIYLREYEKIEIGSSGTIELRIDGKLDFWPVVVMGNLGGSNRYYVMKVNGDPT